MIHLRLLVARFVGQQVGCLHDVVGLLGMHRAILIVRQRNLLRPDFTLTHLITFDEERCLLDIGGIVGPRYLTRTGNRLRNVELFRFCNDLACAVAHFDAPGVDCHQLFLLFRIECTEEEISKRVHVCISKCVRHSHRYQGAILQRKDGRQFGPDLLFVQGITTHICDQQIAIGQQDGLVCITVLPGSRIDIAPRFVTRLIILSHPKTLFLVLETRTIEVV